MVSETALRSFEAELAVRINSGRHASMILAARAGVFAYPAIQLALDPVERVIATGALMGLIGALFGLAALRGRSARATPGAGAAPPA